MKTETEILAEVSGMTRVEIEKRIEPLKEVAIRMDMSDSRFEFMADDKLKECLILEAFLICNVK